MIDCEYILYTVAIFIASVYINPLPKCIPSIHLAAGVMCIFHFLIKLFKIKIEFSGFETFMVMDLPQPVINFLQDNMDNKVHPCVYFFLLQLSIMWIF